MSLAINNMIVEISAELISNMMLFATTLSVVFGYFIYRYIMTNMEFDFTTRRIDQISHIVKSNEHVLSCAGNVVNNMVDTVYQSYTKKLNSSDNKTYYNLGSLVAKQLVKSVFDVSNVKNYCNFTYKLCTLFRSNNCDSQVLKSYCKKSADFTPSSEKTEPDNQNTDDLSSFVKDKVSSDTDEVKTLSIDLLHGIGLIKLAEKFYDREGKLNIVFDDLTLETAVMELNKLKEKILGNSSTKILDLDDYHYPNNDIFEYIMSLHYLITNKDQFKKDYQRIISGDVH